MENNALDDIRELNEDYALVLESMNTESLINEIYLRLIDINNMQKDIDILVNICKNLNKNHTLNEMKELANLSLRLTGRLI